MAIRYRFNKQNSKTRYYYYIGYNQYIHGLPMYNLFVYKLALSLVHVYHNT